MIWKGKPEDKTRNAKWDNVRCFAKGWKSKINELLLSVGEAEHKRAADISFPIPLGLTGPDLVT